MRIFYLLICLQKSSKSYSFFNVLLIMNILSVGFADSVLDYSICCPVFFEYSICWWLSIVLHELLYITSFFIGKSSLDGQFSRAMLNYRRVLQLPIIHPLLLVIGPVSTLISQYKPLLTSPNHYLTRWSIIFWPLVTNDY